MRLAAWLGLIWSHGLQSRCQGKGVDDVASTLHTASVGASSVDETRTKFRDLLAAAFDEGPLEEIPGAADCCKRLSARFPLAVASGNSLPLIQLALRKLEITQFFDAVVSSESVGRGKPAPDVFLAAANALGVEPSRCIVVEDSVPGVLAAKSANMTCVALSGEDVIHETIAIKADHVITCLADLDRSIRALPEPIKLQAIS